MAIGEGIAASGNLMLATALIFMGCGTGAPSIRTPDPTPREAPRTVYPGAPGQPSRVGTGTPAAPPPAASPADVAFMQGMISHHAQALDMTDLIAARTDRRTIVQLGRRIAVSQHDEIALMTAWLADRGIAAADHRGHQMPMPGMLTPEAMRALAETTGDAFCRLFLESMIAHHEGALVMVADLFAADGAGQGSAIYRFATDVDADQRAEIARMRDLLDTLP